MRALRRWVRRGWNFVFRRTGDRRLREEMQEHMMLEMEANLRAGMSPAEARRRAQIDFGPVVTIRESYHAEKGLPTMETLIHDCRFALRKMRKAPGFTAIAALTLALGIGATSTVFSLIQGVLLTPPPYTNPNQLVLVNSARTDGKKQDNQQDWAALEWQGWKKDAHTLNGVAGYNWTFNFLIRNDGSQSMQGMMVSPDYMSLLGVKPIMGRGFADSDFQPGPTRAIILGYDFWQRVFAGDPQIVGKTVRISRWQVNPVVIGVMQPGVRFLPSPGAAKEPNYDVNATVDFFGPAVADPKEVKEPYWDVVARLRDGATVAKAQDELQVLTAQDAREEKRFEGFTPQLERVTDFMNQDGRRILLPLLGASALVLLIACGNVAALLLVRGLQRQQEYAIRISMGMGRGALLRQVLLESLLLALLGGAIGVGLAFTAVRFFKLIAGHAVPRLDSVTTGWAVLVWGLAAAVLAAFFAGITPALRVLRLDPMEVLKNAGSKGSTGLGERRLLRGVAMLQTSLTLALLVGAGLLVRTMMKIAETSSGYNTGRILTMSVTETGDHSKWLPFHKLALEKVAAIPGVQYAAFAWGVPLTGNMWPAKLEVEGQPPAVKESDKVAIPMRAATPDYFKLMGLGLLAGREFRETDDDKAPGVAIVNKAFADHFFPGGDVLGKHFYFDRKQPGNTIVGEIADGRTDDLTHQAEPEIYLPLWQGQAFSKHLVVRTAADPKAVTVAVEQALRAADPSAAVENIRTLEQIRDESLASRIFAMRLLVGFSVVGSVLTLIGIYGVLSLSLASRRKELAIRSAIGAQRSHMRRLIFGEGFRMIGGGVIIGVVLAVMLGQVLRSFLYQVEPGDPVVLVAVGLLFAAVGLLACWVPARRAERVDPLEALRSE